MVKTEVTFENNRILVGAYEVDCDFEAQEYDVCLIHGGFVGSFRSQEEAVTFCLGISD